MLSTGSHLGDKPALSGTLYFNTEGVIEFYAAVKDSLEIVWPLEAMDYGTVEFGIHDCDGTRWPLQSVRTTPRRRATPPDNALQRTRDG